MLKGGSPKILILLMGREGRDCSAGQRGGVQKTTFGKVAVTASLTSGLVAPQHRSLLSCYKRGTFRLSPHISTEVSTPVKREGTAISP